MKVSSFHHLLVSSVCGLAIISCKIVFQNTKKSGSAKEVDAEDNNIDVSTPGTSSDGVPMTEKQKKTADILSNVKVELSSSKSEFVTQFLYQKYHHED